MKTLTESEAHAHRTHVPLRSTLVRDSNEAGWLVAALNEILPASAAFAANWEKNGTWMFVMVRRRVAPQCEMLRTMWNRGRASALTTQYAPESES